MRSAFQTAVCQCNDVDDMRDGFCKERTSVSAEKKVRAKTPDHVVVVGIFNTVVAPVSRPSL